MIEVCDLNLNPIGRIWDTWDNKQTNALNQSGEFEFSMAMESLEIESLSFRQNDALSFLQHQTFIRWEEGGRYWFTGQPYQIERSEESSGDRTAHVKCYGVMHHLSRYNVGVRSYSRTRAWVILQELLNLQPLIRLGTVEMAEEISIDFSREPLLDAIHALRDTLGGDIYVDPDELTLHWVRRQGDIGPEIRYQKNMGFIRFLSDTTEHFTRIIPLGAGEGENRVTIASVNGGVEYLEADTVRDYGVIEQVWEDERYKNPDTLRRAAQRRLEEHKHPSVAYETAMIDLSQWRDEWGERPYRGRVPEVGDEIRIHHPQMGLDIQERLVKVSRNWDEGKRHEIGIELSERKRTWADIVTGIQDRLKTTLYDRGFVFTANYALSHEIGGTETARLRFRLDSAITRINYARLFREGSEAEGETEDPLSSSITVTVNGTPVDSSNAVQRELEIGNYLQIGRWNTVDFRTNGSLQLDASLDIKSFFER
ncbi:phage tail protein [Desmospora profundinema]|uniref:Phage minor structural protein n=1 Tax=Desmospora profundinema TaxID=1571184 RepID=A0ABU1IL02_9BACL|nr:phage tail protein [Desmospora profundinema]MDR6225455.1 phage minor structural protein [Desmospora profundinema]